MKQLVHALKYQGNGWARDRLARLAADQLTNWAGGAAPDAARVVLVPVPPHPVRLRERPWDHSWELARAVSRCLGHPVHQALTRGGWTPSLTHLSETDRRRAVAGAFRLARPGQRLAGAGVCLVDDVCTTGATLSACASRLRRAGPSRICALVAARTPRLSGGEE
ncbi:MAG: ComF family protein [Candidatus Eisenbacteria bacterium]|nr:ComF family protein [Candidatus Eisenbacteria bacterium]